MGIIYFIGLSHCFIIGKPFQVGCFYILCLTLSISNALGLYLSMIAGFCRRYYELSALCAASIWFIAAI